METPTIKDLQYSQYLKFFQIGPFQNIIIQLDSEANRTKIKEMNKLK